MRLKTFGGLWIEGISPPAALGPRPMALLALVGAAGRRGGGISRERVIGILWAEVEENQGRHALSQTLYRIRRETGRDWIVAGPSLQLDPSITSDIGEFQDAVAAGEHESAAALYAGPFLEGFYLSGEGAGEFNRWVEGERARLARAATGALRRLSELADRQGDHPAAVRAWTRLTELDPLSARYATGLMRALAASGDRASALAHAREHEIIVRRELETDVDPEVRDLAGTLRAGRSSAAGFQAPARLPASQPSADGTALPAPPQASSAGSARANAWRGVVVGAILIAVAAAGILLIPDRAADPVTPVLAVGTIRTPDLGDSASVDLVLRDLLATTLGGQHEMQVIANSRLVELTPPDQADLPAATGDAARRAGASEILEGELRTEGQTLILTLRRVDLELGVVRRGYVVRAANRYALVDSAAAAVARDLGLTPPAIPARDVRTTSAEAYLLYTEGLRAYYGFDAPAAHRLMHAALDRDSSFAMAAYYAWLIGEAVTDPASNRREFDLVKRLAAGTIERERLLIQAELARREAPVAVAAALAETLAVRYPADPDGHVVLGLVRFDQGAWPASVAAFRQAFLLDSVATIHGPFCRLCVALGFMIGSYQWWDSAGAAERVGRQLIALRPDDPAHWSTLAEVLLRQGRRSEAEAALTRSGTLSAPLNVWASMLNRDLIRWGRFDELDQRLLIDVASPRRETRGDARWLLTLSLRDQGRIRDAMALGREGRIPGTGRTVPEPAPEVILSAMLLADLGLPDSAARLLHREARQVLAAHGMWPGQQARRATWYLTLAATAYAEAGDTAVVRRLADSTEGLGRRSTFGRDLTLHHFLRGLLLQREGRHPEAVEAFRRSLFSPTDGYTRINLALAWSLMALGKPGEAIAVLRPAIHGGVDGGNTYTSRTELHEAMAEAFTTAGQPDSAVAHYRMVERGWRRADPEFAERYRRAAAAMSSRGGPAAVAIPPG